MGLTIPHASQTPLGTMICMAYMSDVISSKANQDKLPNKSPIFEGIYAFE